MGSWLGQFDKLAYNEIVSRYTKYKRSIRSHYSYFGRYVKMDREKLFADWCDQIESGERKDDALRNLSKDHNLPQNKIKIALKDRGIWEKNVLRSNGYDVTKIVDNKSLKTLYENWSDYKKGILRIKMPLDYQLEQRSLRNVEQKH